MGWKLLDARIIEEVAQHTGLAPEVVQRCDERVDSMLYRLVKSVWHGGTERAVSGPAAGVAFDAEEMAVLSRRVIERAAELGEYVIVGRGSQCLLQRRTDTLHVFTYAPRAWNATGLFSHESNRC